MIVGYFAEIDAARLGVGMLAIVGIQAAHDWKLVEMVAQINKIPECDGVYVVTGEWDLLVFLRVRDQHHLSEVLFSSLWKAQGFRHSETMIVLHRETVPSGQLVGYPNGKAAVRSSRRKTPAALPRGRRPRVKKAARASG